MKAKSLLFSLLAAAALMVSCNNDPEEVVIVSDSNPNINGTWIYSDNDDQNIYKLTVDGTTFSAEYTGNTGGYDTTGGFVTMTTQMYRTFENCVIKTSDLGETTASFVYDYSATIYPDIKSFSSKTGTVNYVYDSFSYELINDCLVIHGGLDTQSINTGDYYDNTNSVSYTDINGGLPMIQSGVYYRE